METRYELTQCTYERTTLLTVILVAVMKSLKFCSVDFRVSVDGLEETELNAR